jgi:hypothetical protein
MGFVLDHYHPLLTSNTINEINQWCDNKDGGWPLPLRNNLTVRNEIVTENSQRPPPVVGQSVQDAINQSM